jgi:hypothetical protein
MDKSPGGRDETATIFVDGGTIRLAVPSVPIRRAVVYRIIEHNSPARTSAIYCISLSDNAMSKTCTWAARFAPNGIQL